jgi:hypothetical protein
MRDGLEMVRTKRLTASLVLLCLTFACANHEKDIAALQRKVSQLETDLRSERIASDSLRAALLAKQAEVNAATARAAIYEKSYRTSAEILAAAVTQQQTPSAQPVVTQKPFIMPNEPTYERRTERPSPATYDAGIIAHCTAKWATNYEMVEYCEKQQETAKAAMAARQSSNRSLLYDDIRRECDRKWEGDYEMRDYCETQQLGASQRIGRN